MRTSAHLILVTPVFGRASGGAGVSASRIVEALAGVMNVTVVQLDPEATPDRYESLSDANGTGPRLLRIYYRQETAASGQFLFDLLEHLREKDVPTVIGAFYLGHHAAVARWAARYLGCKFVAFGRGNDADLDAFSPVGQMTLAALADADAVFTVSQEMARKLSAMQPAMRVVPIANGVDPGQFPLTPQRETTGARLVCGMFGEVKDKKGLDVLLEALDFASFDLRIVGRLREREAKLLHGFMTFHASRREQIEVQAYANAAEDVAKAYQGVDIVVVPSIHDGMPNVVLEAMATGRIVVGTTVGGIPELIDDGVTGFLAPPRDPEAFAGALAQAAQVIRSGLGEEFGARARAKILSYSDRAREASAYRAEFAQIIGSPI